MGRCEADGTSPGHEGEPQFDAVIVGAGFAGLYMLHRLRSDGLRVRVVERGSDIGGTWFWNCYPGARCDIDSLDYQYSFSKELREQWRWSERYAAQPEILAYLNFVADRLDLRRDIQLGTRVEAAAYDEEADCWTVDTNGGDRLTSRFCIMAVGCLSLVKKPDFEGIDDFAGAWYHTAEWPRQGVDFSGKRVAVIGTGSTAIQAVPRIAEQAERLWVFQRTANYSMPARNRPLSDEYVAEVLQTFEERRRMCEWSDAGVPVPYPEKSALAVSEEERRAMYEAGWERGGINALSYAFTDFFTDEEANKTAQDFAREKIRQVVKDPLTAELLSPAQHIGTKRTCVDTGYFETFNRENVELVDLAATPIVRLTEHGIETTAREYEVDAIVFAIGFDAITGALLAVDIRGVGSVSLRDAWAGGPRTYLGLTIAGFPNLFTITGPQSPSVLSNMIVSIEQHVDFIARCLGYMRERGLRRVEASESAQERWVEHVRELGERTLYPKARSWYVGANVPGKPRVFMPYVGGCGRYRKECENVVEAGYEGFVFQPRREYSSAGTSEGSL